MKDVNSKSCIFGPVPSRRLGLSLGVDIVPMKTCTQNCLYCQLGKNASQTLERKVYVPVNQVLDDLNQSIKEGLDADYITISGSGEPTLHSELGVLIDQIHHISSIPVAVITNGTLLSIPEVRHDCIRADVVLPSLDAGDEKTFQKMNHPHADLDFEHFIDGLRSFRSEYTGPIWLEVFICHQINDNAESIEKMKCLIDLICPDRVQLNTLARPGTDPQAKPASHERLLEIASFLGPTTEIIADFTPQSSHESETDPSRQIIETLKRRPCTLNDLCQSLNFEAENTKKLLNSLLASKQIRQDTVAEKQFYRI